MNLKSAQKLLERIKKNKQHSSEKAVLTNAKSWENTVGGQTKVQSVYLGNSSGPSLSDSID